MNCTNVVMCYQHFVTLALLFRDLTKADSAPMEERPRVSLLIFILLVFDLFLCTFTAAPNMNFMHIATSKDVVVDDDDDVSCPRFLGLMGFPVFYFVPGFSHH